MVRSFPNMGGSPIFEKGRPHHGDAEGKTILITLEALDQQYWTCQPRCVKRSRASLKWLWVWGPLYLGKRAGSNHN